MARKSSKGVRSIKGSEERYLGSEPKYPLNKKLTSSNMSDVYNWYNYFSENKHLKKYALTYLKNSKVDKEKINAIARHPEFKFNVFGMISKFITNHNYSILPTETKKFFEDKFKELLNTAPKEDVTNASLLEENKPSIQERIRAKNSEIIAEFEEQLDNFIKTGKSDFEPYKWLVSNNIKAHTAKKIAEYYKPIVDELENATGGEDEELRNAYRNLSDKELSDFKQFVSKIYQDANTVALNAKNDRKPRKKKFKSVEQIVSKIKYKKLDDNFKIRSIQPETIVGAIQLWVFNTKLRKLGVYNAIDDVGLSMKGTTIQGFNETTSIQKKIRKPLDILPKVTQGGKVVLRKILDDINAKENILNGRINNDTILLRSVK